VSRFSNGHWIFPEQMGNGKLGFVYVIRDNVLQRFYLGKKLYYGHGKLNKNQESNWRKYASSSKVLAELLKARPKEEFEFICLEQYNTKGTLSYSETWSLCTVEAPTDRRWYNTLVNKVSWNVKEPITQRHKDRLKAAVNFEDVD
jgi:Putative endonuclease segE, GIY-YIG domain